MAVQRTDNAGSPAIECPSEAQLRKDIRCDRLDQTNLTTPGSSIPRLEAQRDFRTDTDI